MTCRWYMCILRPDCKSGWFKAGRLALKWDGLIINHYKHLNTVVTWGWVYVRLRWASYSLALCWGLLWWFGHTALGTYMYDRSIELAAVALVIAINYSPTGASWPAYNRAVRLITGPAVYNQDYTLKNTHSMVVVCDVLCRPWIVLV